MGFGNREGRKSGRGDPQGEGLRRDPKRGQSLLRPNKRSSSFQARQVSECPLEVPPALSPQEKSLSCLLGNPESWKCATAQNGRAWEGLTAAVATCQWL